MNQIGRLKHLRRYPVKSMKGEDLERVFVAYSGVAGDRVFAFVDPAKKTNFPWVSARQVAEMLLFEPRFLEPPAETVQYPDKKNFRVEVKTPEGKVADIEDPAFLKELEKRWNRPLILRFSEKGMQDAQPLSIFGMSALAKLGDEVGAELDHRRFRANLYIEWTEGSEALLEEKLVGSRLQIGDKLTVMITKKDPRCVIINLDPETAQSNPEVLKTVGKLHEGCIGVYAAVIREGIIQSDSPVYLLS